MTAIELHFVKPLTEFYGRNPFGPGFARKLEPYGKTLSDDVLQAVANRLIERGGKSFPSFQACRDALSRSEEAVSRPGSTEIKPWDIKARDALAWEKRKNALRLCRCEMGREADREGWLPALLEFCEDHMRLPQAQDEVASVKAKARRSEDGLERARGTPFYVQLVGWRKAMLDRAHQDVFGFIEQREAAE